MLPAGDDCKSKEMMGDWLRRIVVVVLLFLFCNPLAKGAACCHCVQMTLFPEVKNLSLRRIHP